MTKILRMWSKVMRYISTMPANNINISSYLFCLTELCAF